MPLLEAVQATIRPLHSTPSTEAAYLHGTCELIRFHEGRHPRFLGAVEVTVFLDPPAVERRIAAATQNQGFCAIVFLDKQVLELDVPELDGLQRAQRPRHLPAVIVDRGPLGVKSPLDR